MTERQNPQPGVLWVSSRNQLACPEHAPPIATAEWWSGQWRVFSEDEQRGFHGARGEPPACFACRAVTELGPSTLDSRAQTVATLARRLGVEDLEELGNDDADFQDIHIGLLREALEDAYDAGRASAQGDAGGIR